MNQKKALVFATNNQHKLEEARRIVSDGFQIVSLAEINCHDEIPETADTLEGNALQKARWVRDRYGYDCFADDTGLCVEALNGAPGVYSARYAGEHCTPDENVTKLLHEMEGIENRDAQFRTVIALCADGEEHCFTGSVDGEITTERHGDGGFGYDPIFRAKESGKCFAEMSADDKNAISHRGRALRKLRDFLGIIVAAIITLTAAFSANAEQWRILPTYDGSLARIIDTKDRLYVLPFMQPYEDNSGLDNFNNIYINLFVFDKESEEWRHIGRNEGASEYIVNCAEYNYDGKYLMVAYDNGNIDIFYDNGEIKNIPALLLADSELSRRPRSITFSPDNGHAFVATDFGYAEIDPKKGEVAESRIYRRRVNAAVRFKGILFVSTPEGNYYSEGRGQSFSDLEALRGISKPVQRFLPWGDRLYALHGKFGSPASGYYSISNGVPTGSVISQNRAYSLERGAQTLSIVEGNRILQFDTAGKQTEIARAEADKDCPAASYDGREYWVSNGRKGVSRKRVPAAGQSAWTVTANPSVPNAANAFIATKLAIHPTYGVLLRNHGINSHFFIHLGEPDLIAGYKDGKWTPLSTTYRGDFPGMTIYNPGGVAIDPLNKDHVYCGSQENGMLRLDLANPAASLHMTAANDHAGGMGKPGFVDCVPVHSDKDYPTQCGFADPVFDTSGILWTAHIDPDKTPISGGGTPYVELWYWTPADREASKSVSSFRPWHKLSYRIQPSYTYSIFATQTSANKNLVLFHAGNKEAPILVLDHQGNPGSSASRKEGRLTLSATNQDGKELNRDLNMLYVTAWHEDPSTGLVWVGHNAGVFTFNPRGVLAGTPDVRSIKVSRDDGTGLADYLLNDIEVTGITSDSQGRKWFATMTAGVVCTSADGRTVLKSYTSDNSMLPDNAVYSIIYNPASNSIIMSTGKGNCELYLSSAGGDGDEDTARAYPNPVRPDYFGYVTIDGLPEDATVKITDAAGNLIRDLGRSSSGECRWDVTNIHHKRVPAGVYLVLASNGPDAEAFSKVSKILVVN